jgi:hypothetical protein
MKPDLLPEFVRGTHFRELNTRAAGKKRWKFVTTRGIRLSIPNLTSGILVFHDTAGRIWGRMDKFGIYIESGYSWSGCSPKLWVWPFGLIGAIDFEETILASLFHDFMYQFAPTYHFPIHRSDCDSIFHNCIAMADAPRVASIYHRLARRYGTWSGKLKTGVFSTVL